jgi:hypothetical protein
MNSQYQANQIPLAVRALKITVSAVLLVYGSYGIFVNDLYVPGKHGPGIHLHNVPALVMYSAIICACSAMLSVVVDHYDRRNNESGYRLFGRVAEYFGWALFALSLVDWWFTAR